MVMVMMKRTKVRILARGARKKMRNVGGTKSSQPREGGGHIRTLRKIRAVLVEIVGKSAAEVVEAGAAAAVIAGLRIPQTAIAVIVILHTPVLGVVVEEGVIAMIRVAADLGLRGTEVGRKR
jgi:hypothetical protein